MRASRSSAKAIRWAGQALYFLSALSAKHFTFFDQLILFIRRCPVCQVARLEQLLEKSIAYSEFLANKIKQEGQDGAVAVRDGSVAGVGLAQPKLVQGNMRPYQLVGVHWLVGLYENGLVRAPCRQLVQHLAARRARTFACAHAL